MLKTKLLKRTLTSHIYTDDNNINSFNEQNFLTLLNKFFIASTEYFKISKGNYNQMLKLLSILEEKNNNNNFYDEDINFNDEDIFQKDDIKIINDLKLILSTNNNNLNNFYNDSKILLKSIETIRNTENQKMIRSKSDKRRQVIISPISKNKTIENNNHNDYNNFNFSPINSFIRSNTNNNETISINKDNKMYSLFNKLSKFKEIVGAYSPDMKNIFEKIYTNLYNEFKKIEKEKQEDKINLGIKNTKINDYQHSFSKEKINIKDNGYINSLKDKINMYKIKNENSRQKIDELKCQLEDLKSYSSTLERTLEDKNINNYYNNNITHNKKLENVIQKNNNLLKNVNHLNELNIKLKEENNIKKSLLKKNEQNIKQLILNNNNLKIKLKEYENIIYKNNNNKENINEKNNEILTLNQIIMEKESQINIQQKEIKELIIQKDNLNIKITKLLKNNNKNDKNKPINEIKFELLGKKNEEENEYKIKYDQKKKEINSLKQEYINKINNLTNTIANNNIIIENKDKLINELKLNQGKVSKSNNNNNDDSDKNINIKDKKLEEEIYKLKKENENLIKVNLELTGIKESININEQKNKDIIRELNQDKLLLENEIEEFKKKNEKLNKEINESRNKFDNENNKINNINNINNISIKESYNKKVSKTHNDLIKKINMLENEIENKNQELEGLKNFIQKLQKEKEDNVLNKDKIFDNNIININNNNSNNEMKLKKEIEKLKAQLEHLSTTFPKEMEDLRKENEKLIMKYNNLKNEKNSITN